MVSDDLMNLRIIENLVKEIHFIEINLLINIKGNIKGNKAVKKMKAEEKDKNRNIKDINRHLENIQKRESGDIEFILFIIFIFIIYFVL